MTVRETSEMRKRKRPLQQKALEAVKFARSRGVSLSAEVYQPEGWSNRLYKGTPDAGFQFSGLYNSSIHGITAEVRSTGFESPYSIFAVSIAAGQLGNCEEK